MMEPELCINPQILHDPSYAWSYAGSSTGSIGQGNDSGVVSPTESRFNSPFSPWCNVSTSASSFDDVPIVDSPITATADERLYLNQLFQTAVQEVENLDKAILQGQIELLHLFQQKQASIDILKARRQTHIVRWKKFFALIYKLPDDVLLLIFELYVLEGGSPWTVAHVSKRFRDVAFKARKIWGRIVLKPTFSPFTRYHEGWEVCKTTSQLQRALSRSGGTALTISIHSCDIIDSKILTSHPGRWDKITYADHGKQEVDTELFGNIPRLASVTKLHVVGGGLLVNSRLAEWIQASPPPHLVLSEHYLHTYRQNGNWASLRALEIKLPKLSPATHTLVHPSTVIIADILQASKRNLTSLSLENVPFNEASFFDLLEFPRVEELRLHSVKQWHLLQAPNATKYSLGFGRGPWYENTVDLQFTSQVELEFVSAFETKTQGILTTEDQLTITGTQRWSIARRSVETPVNGEIASRPYMLHLVDVQAGSDELIRELRRHSNLLELHIHNSATAPILFKAFSVDPTSSRLGKPPLLPRLSVLNVELASKTRTHGPKAKESYDSTFKKISEVRKKKLGILKRLTVRYPNGMGGSTESY